MNAFEVAYVINGIVIISIVLWLIYGPWQSFVTDWTRQCLFELRGHLFDDARAGKIDFSAKDYITERDFLNTMIRYHHLFTSYRIFVILLITLRPATGKAIQEELTKIKPDIKKYHNRATSILLRSFILRSPITTAFILIPALTAGVLATFIFAIARSILAIAVGISQSSIIDQVRNTWRAVVSAIRDRILEDMANEPSGGSLCKPHAIMHR